MDRASEVGGRLYDGSEGKQDTLRNWLLCLTAAIESSRGVEREKPEDDLLCLWREGSQVRIGQLIFSKAFWENFCGNGICFGGQQSNRSGATTICQLLRCCSDSEETHVFIEKPVRSTLSNAVGCVAVMACIWIEP